MFNPAASTPSSPIPADENRLITFLELFNAFPPSLMVSHHAVSKQ